MQITGRSLRLHLMVYSALTLLLTLGLVTIVAWFPLSRRITASAENNIRHDTEMRARYVDETLRRISELGWQVSSRTAARITTTEFERGLISREEAANQLTPRLRDAVEFSHELRSLIRLDRSGASIVAVGVPVPDSILSAQIKTRLAFEMPHEPLLAGRQGLSEVFQLNHAPHIALYTPVFSPDQHQVATDVLVFDLSALRSSLSLPLLRQHGHASSLVARNSAGTFIEQVLQAGTQTVPDLGEWSRKRIASQLGSESRLFTLGEDLVCATPLQGCPWWLMVAAPRKSLLKESHTWLLSILVTVLGLGLIGLLGSMVLMRPLRDKILVAQDDLLRQVATMDQTRTRLEQQSNLLMERNEDLRHFAYASAHDLKSPLISIGGHAQILLDRLGPDLEPERRQSLEYILAGSKRMFQHVNDMLDYSRAAEIEPRWVRLSLDRLCHDVLGSLDGRLRESHAVVSLAQLPVILGDRHLLRMILQNLIDNALCYRQPDRVPEIVVEAELRDEEVAIRVRDNGLGISPDHQPQVFESFYRLHDDAKIPGTGLGLAIVQRAVHQLNGAIELESEPGLGSCFTVRIPQPAAVAMEGGTGESGT